jgi:hypothetical protein
MNDETKKELVNGLINYGMGKIEKDSSKNDGANFTISHAAIMNTIILKAALEYILIQKVIPNTSDEDIINLFKEFYDIVFYRNIQENKEKADVQINGIIAMNLTQYKTFHKLLQHGAKSKEFLEFVSKSIQSPKAPKI